MVGKGQVGSKMVPPLWVNRWGLLQKDLDDASPTKTELVWWTYVVPSEKTRWRALSNTDGISDGITDAAQAETGSGELIRTMESTR